MTLNEVIGVLYKEMLYTADPKKLNAYAVAIKAVKSWQKKDPNYIPEQLSFDDILKEDDSDDKK